MGIVLGPGEHPDDALHHIVERRVSRRGRHRQLAERGADQHPVEPGGDRAELHVRRGRADLQGVLVHRARRQHHHHQRLAVTQADDLDVADGGGLAGRADDHAGVAGQLGQ